MAKSSQIPSQFVDGLQLPENFSADSVRSALTYQPLDDDLFIVTYPKCGTTWIQQIVLLILRQGKPLHSASQFFTLTPFLEKDGTSDAEFLPRPGPIKIHLPYHLSPRSSHARYIHLVRNPKDCCISLYHHIKNMPGHCYEGNFDDYFEIFLSGKVFYGDYFDHVLGWYEHSRNDPNVLFVTYEETKEHPEETILKLASFIDDEKYAKPLRDDPTKLEFVLKYSGFEYMKIEFNQAMDKMFSASKEEYEKSFLSDKYQDVLLHDNFSKTPSTSRNFIRKGMIGDWKNHFNEDQNRRMNQKIAERFEGTELETLWEKYI